MKAAAPRNPGRPNPGVLNRCRSRSRRCQQERTERVTRRLASRRCGLVSTLLASASRAFQAALDAFHVPEKTAVSSDLVFLSRLNVGESEIWPFIGGLRRISRPGSCRLDSITHVVATLSAFARTAPSRLSHLGSIVSASRRARSGNHEQRGGRSDNALRSHVDPLGRDGDERAR